MAKAKVKGKYALPYGKNYSHMAKGIHTGKGKRKELGPIMRSPKGMSPVVFRTGS